MDPPGLNLRVTRPGEEVAAMKIRLDVIALQRMNLLRPELIKNNGSQSELDEVKSLWKIGQDILTRCYGERGIRAIRLMKALVYFDDFAIDWAIFANPTRESVIILKICGLIRFGTVRYQGEQGEIEVGAVKIHAKIFREMLRQENEKERKEVLIGDCLLILKHKPAQVDPKKRDRNFPVLWTHVLRGNYVGLMKEFKEEALEFCSAHCKNSALTKFMTKMLEKLKEMYTGEGEDNNVFRMECTEVEIRITLFGSEDEEVKLQKLKQYISTFEEFLQNHTRGDSTDGRVKSLEHIISVVGQQCEAEDSMVLKDKFLEECIRGHKDRFEYHRAGQVQVQYPRDSPFSTTMSGLLGIFNCSSLLKKKEPIVEILGQMLIVLKEHPGHEHYSSGPSLWNIVFEELLRYCECFPPEDKNDILKELSLVLKYMNESVFNSLHPRFCLNLRSFIEIYTKCLIKSGDFEHIVQMMQTVNGRWKRKCESLVGRSVGLNRMDDFIEEFFDWQKSHVFEKTLDPIFDGIKEKLIGDSIAASRNILNIVVGIGRGCATHYNYEFSGPLYIAYCCLEVEHLNELIEFSSELELFIHQKFEQQPQILIQEWSRFLENQDELIRDEIESTEEEEKKPKPNYLPLLRAMRDSAERLALKIDKFPVHDKQNSEVVLAIIRAKIAQNIIEFCDSYESVSVTPSENVKSQ